MTYSKVKKEFSPFIINENRECVSELKKEIIKVRDLLKYYRNEYFNSNSNASYFYDLFIFFDEKRMELEMVLEKYELEMIKKGVLK